jgi:hypothetical protein
VPINVIYKTNWEKPKREQKGIMKQYYAIVKITWTNFGVEGINVLDAIKKLKQTYLEQYGIALENNEIVEIKEDK